MMVGSSNKFTVIIIRTLFLLAERYIDTSPGGGWYSARMQCGQQRFNTIVGYIFQCKIYIN